MGECEIEEGEACDYMDNDDRNIDIDVALSYIDDRIQDILGQYQKDFEGGVSADTLGARFGGYGTFLPTYQRSPSTWSNPVAQHKVQSHGIQASSLDDQLVEGALQNSTGSISETVSARPEAASRSAFPLRVAKPFPEDRLVKPQSSRECVSGYEPQKGPVNPSNQKMLKVRIKVGSDNCLPELKTSAIYSNLGLDMSPSSSSEDTDSPSECERDFPDSLEEHIYSPSYIVRIMTSSPIPSGAMLSPLHDCLLNLSEKRFLDHKRTVPVKEFSAMQADEKVLVDRQKKPANRSDRLEVKNELCDDPTNSFSACSKNESSMETSKGNHTLFDAGNHPPESKTTKVGKAAVRTGTIFRANLSGAMKELFSQKACKIHEVSAKATLTGKVQKDKKIGCAPRDDGSEGDKSHALFKDNYMPEGMRKCGDGTLDPTKHKFKKKKSSHLQDEMKVPHGKQPSTGKKKPKGSKNDYSSTAGTSNNSMLIRLSAEPKEKIFQKICKGDNALLEDLRKVKVKHTASSGDRKARGNEFRSCLLGTSVEDETEDNTLEVPEKEPLAFRNKSNVNSGDKKTSFVSTSKENLRGDINDVAPLARPLPTEVPTFLIQEDWVCCDKCHKWRLLPYGTNPNQLPQKWLCSMLDWLPGMNHCTFSEEETTDALHALYRLPVAGNHGGQLSHSASAESSITLVNTLHDLDQNPQDPSFSGGKKKLEMKEVSHPAQYSVNKKQLNSTMKNEQVFIERSLHNRSLSSLETKLQKRLGDVQPQKFKSMKEADQEGFKHSKKARMEGMQYAVEDHNTGGISKKEMGSNNKKHSSCIDVRYLSKDSTSLDVKKHQFQKTMVTEDLEPMGIEGKKRKSKDWMNNQIYPGKHSGNGQDNSISMEETSWSECRKERHSRKCKYEEKDCSTSKGVCKLFGKEKINYSSQSTVDGKNSERRDLSDGLQWMAATSSSSLISSTCKVKINFQDFKDSPVESVCSSPLKISKRVSPRSFSGNHGSTDVGFCHFSDQTKCLEGESVGVSNWSETLRKENAPAVALIKEKSRDIYRHNDDKVERKNPGQKVSSFKSLNNSTREDGRFGREGYDASLRKMDAVSQKDCKSSARHNALQNHNNSEFLDLFPSDTINQVEKSAGRQQSLDFLVFGNKKENQCWKSRESDELEVDGSSCDGLGRAPRQLGKDEGQNGAQDVMRRHHLLDASNILASHHLRNDFFSQVANDALEGVKDLKQLADPLQISASGLQIAELFFQAALKFLHGASLFNPDNNSTNSGNMTSAEMYSHAAKLCEKLNLKPSWVPGGWCARALYRIGGMTTCWATKKDKKVNKETAFIRNGSKLLEKLVDICDGKCNSIRRFSATELKKATNNYDPRKLLIWNSGYKLYKGFLQGRPVSVKKFKDDDEQYERCFNDIVYASKMSVHKSFVKLLGCCLETQIPILVFEYVGDRTLYDCLWGSEEARCRHLLWIPRSKIAMDMANAVAFLHAAFARPIVYRNINPRNILLDDNHEAKLSDFSYSISIPEGESHVKGAAITGSIGFMAPEYWTTGDFNEKQDVYNFGVILLMLLSAQRPYDYSRPEEKIFLMDRVKKCIEDDRLNEAIDSTIIAEGAWPGKEQQLQAFAALALRCLSQKEEDRPSMIDVSKELRKIHRSAISCRQQQG